MLTNNKEITTPEYWDRVYSGKNDNAKVDASNTVRPANTFDRFQWVADYAEGPNVLGVGSGHAHVEKRIKAAHPDWKVEASDQSTQAREVSKYEPYHICDACRFLIVDAYVDKKPLDTIICTQALEYMQEPRLFFRNAEKYAHYLLITVPKGEMTKWSQLRIYDETAVQAMLIPYGKLLVLETKHDLILAKVKLND